MVGSVHGALAPGPRNNESFASRAWCAPGHRYADCRRWLLRKLRQQLEQWDREQRRRSEGRHVIIVRQRVWLGEWLQREQLGKWVGEQLGRRLQWPGRWFP